MRQRAIQRDSMRLNATQCDSMRSVRQLDLGLLRFCAWLRAFRSHSGQLHLSPDDRQFSGSSSASTLLSSAAAYVGSAWKWRPSLGHDLYLAFQSLLWVANTRCKPLSLPSDLRNPLQARPAVRIFASAKIRKVPAWNSTTFRPPSPCHLRSRGSGQNPSLLRTTPPPSGVQQPQKSPPKWACL